MSEMRRYSEGRGCVLRNVPEKHGKLSRSPGHCVGSSQARRQWASPELRSETESIYRGAAGRGETADQKAPCSHLLPDPDFNSADCWMFFPASEGKCACSGAELFHGFHFGNHGFSSNGRLKLHVKRGLKNADVSRETIQRMKGAENGQNYRHRQSEGRRLTQCIRVSINLR